MINDLMILGVNGMLGSTLFKYFSDRKSVKIVGILRKRSNLPKSYKYYKSKDIYEYNFIENYELEKLFNHLQPKIIINCAGIVKQHPSAKDPINNIQINALFPHRLNKLCNLRNVKLIHISTDCVFSGKKGFYNENDFADPIDLYGMSKFLGEVITENALTLRTSYIGEELISQRGLLSWFLSQKDTVQGFSKAIYSGLPTVEIARIIDQFILPKLHLKGLYHISSDPIDKFSLLNIINNVYKKNIKIIKETNFSINRSLDSSKFRIETGYQPLEWDNAIEIMKDFGNTKNE